jgi:hypothetical protein
MEPAATAVAATAAMFKPRGEGAAVPELEEEAARYQTHPLALN